MKKIISIILILFFIVAGFLAKSYYSYINTPIGLKEDTLFKVNKNDTVGKIISGLEKEGIIKNRFFFKVMVKLRGGDRNILFGYYLIQRDSTPKSIWEKMLKGEVERYKLTIPEGYNIYQIAQIVENQRMGNRKKILSLTKDKKFIRTLGLDLTTLEGYLYPATYFFDPDTKEEEIIETMVKKSFQILKDELKLSDKSPKEIHHILTLASLIEKEAKVKEEMPLISSVFHNRLEKKMKLQCDPTVQYGLLKFDYNLTKKDLMTKNPYNTYVNFGLPPTPIANPSKEAILAALNPAKTNYLYFVSKNDGTHYFSEDLKKHNKAVYNYQIKNKKGKI